MERLTWSHYGGDGHYMKCSERMACDGNCGECDELDKIVDRLAYYEDMEEQGRLVVLPCQWGTKLYSIYAELYHLNEDGEPPIKEVWLVENNVCAIIRQFGKTVFLDREEAENALKGGAENA